MNYRKLLISSVLSLCLVSGCIFRLGQPRHPKVQWGKAGEQPTEVWKYYDWEIKALGDY